MKRKTIKKTKDTAEKESRGKKISQKENCAGPVVLGVAMGIAVGMFVSVLYFQWQAEFNPPKNPLPGKPAEADSKASFGPEKSATSVPGAVSSSALFVFSGTVTKIEGKKIFVDYFSCGKGSKTYSVAVTKSTVITKRENQTENKATFSDIRKSNNVAVRVSEDINKESDLTAREIKIMGEANMPAPAGESP